MVKLSTATFTHDATGAKDRLDFDAGVTPEGRFYLSNGGFFAGNVHYGQAMTIPKGGKPPSDIILK